MNISERVDLVTHIPPEYTKLVVPPPRCVKIELTNACNLKCKFCACSKKQRPVGNMDWNLFQRLTTDLKDSGVQEVGLFYLGESFLYKSMGEWKLPDAIYFTKKMLKFPRVFLTTNGVNSTKDKLQQVISSGLDSLKFSFNYATAKQSKDISQFNIFNKIIQNIKDARVIIDEIYNQTGHRCELSASSILYDEFQEAKMQQAIEQISGYVDHHYWIPFCNQGGLTTDLKTKNRGNIGRTGNMVNPIPCWSLFTGAHITYDGNVTICCFDHNNKFSVGNIINHKFMDIWNGSLIQTLRSRHLSGNIKGTVCEKCINS